MDLKATVEMVMQKAVDGAKVVPVLVKTPGLAEDQLHVLIPATDGCAPEGPTLITLPPKPRAYKAESLEGMCQQVTHFADRQTTGVTVAAASEQAGESGRRTISPTIAVFAGEGQVSAYLAEDGDRRDTIEMELVHSDAFRLLEDWEARLQNVKQEDFAWMLKTELGDELTPGNFASQVKSLKFSRAVNRDSEIQTGRESLGQSVLAEVSGLNSAFPDEITVRCPVYSNIRNSDGDEFKFDVRCAVRINTMEGKFTLRPLSGELEAAQHAADAHVAQRIRNGVPAGVVVFECSAVGE